MDPLSIVAIITSLGSIVIILGKTIKESTCGCCRFVSRTPQPSIQYIPPTPSPQVSPQVKRKEENNSEEVAV
jgi:hypothetical protein